MSNRKIHFNHILDVDRLPDNPVIIDAGANIGGYLEAILEMGLNAKVISLECSDTNFEKILAKNLKSKFKSLILLNSALGGEDGTATFTEFVGEPKGDGTNKYHQWGNINNNFVDVLKDKSKINRYSVKVVTIEHLMIAYGLDYIDFLKMDIEGAEYDVIGSITPDMAERIGQISMETHNKEKNPGLINKLKELGYEVEQHPGSEIYAYRNEISNSN